jgi:hypothetical protein
MKKHARAWTRVLAPLLALAAGLTAVQSYGQGATGGTITLDGSVWVHTFTNGGNFVVTQQIQNVEILVVGGGGAGGGGNSTAVGNGGGGGGDFVTNSYSQLAAQTIAVTIGAGGVGGLGLARLSQLAGAVRGNANDFAGLG